MSVRSLLHVLQEDNDNSHSLVFQHYPVEWHETDVQNYLEKLTGTAVKTVCIPAANCDVAVVIFDDVVYDRAISRWQDKAFRKGAGNCFPTFELLGKPTGIFIPDVPDGINDDRLGVKSGGIEGTVKLVEQVAIKEKKYGVIMIDNELALESILSKQHHTLGETELELGPFYPSVHRYILDTLRNGGIHCESVSAQQMEKQFVQHSLKPADVDMSSASLSGLDTGSNTDKSKDLNPGISFSGGRNEDRLITSRFGDEDRQIYTRGESSNPKVATVKPVVRHKRDISGIQHTETSREYERAQYKSPGYEYEQDVVIVKKLSQQKFDLLSRTRCLSWLRSKCEKENIKVVFVTDDNSKEIMCHSFSVQEARKGIQLLEQCVTTTIVKVKPEQQVRLHDPTWSALRKSLENDFTSIYLKDNGASICIDSLIESQAGEAQQKVSLYLNTDTEKKKLAKVSLETAKARCFQARIEDKLRQEIQKKNGKLNVEQLHQCPLKLQLSCEGPEGVSDMFTKAIQGIWHESVDFTKISAAGDDTWLIMKALDKRIGTDFISKFEQKHNCFIHISADGEIQIQRARVNIEDVFESSDDEATGMGMPDDCETDDSESASDTSQSPEFKQFEKPGKRRYRGNRPHRFHTGLSEEEELQRALQLSMQDPADCTEDKPGKQIDQRNLKSRSIIFSGTKVTIVKGPIAKQKADALVNVVSKSQSPFQGTVAKSFLEMGGQELLQMYNTKSSSASGNVVVTESSGCLQCTSVLHAQLQESPHWEKIVRSVISEVLDECVNWGLKVVAFPPLGIGRLFRFPPQQVAETMLSELSRKLSTVKNNLKKISLVVYDTETYTIFEKAFEAFNTDDTRQGMIQPRVSDQRSAVRGMSEVSDASRLPPSGARGRERPNTDSQSRGRHQTSRDRMNTVASHHRGSRSSSGSSGNSHNTSDRNTASVGNQNHIRKRMKNSPRRYHGNSVPNFSVKIIAENREECTRARDSFYKKVKEKFLYEEMIEKTQKLSAVSKKKIKAIVSDNGIKSVKEKDKYKLKGLKANVIQARAEIYKVLLEEKNREQKRNRKTKPKRETREFVEVMIEDDPEAPCYWKNYKEGETLLQSAKRFFTGNKFEKVLLNKDSREFKSIVKMINATFDRQLVGQGRDAAGLDNFGYTKLFVLKVERIENFVLYEQFTKKRQFLYRKLYLSGEVRFPRIEKLPNCKGPIATSNYIHPCLDQDIHPEINEHLLFHSTKKERISVICNDGFDSRLGSGTSMFGQGIYGAEKATKADQYADDKDSRSAGEGNPKKMFLIRMVLGNGYLCSDDNPYKFRRPPCTRCYRDDCTKGTHVKGKFGHFFDSVVGNNSKLFREFVVYENSQCYPEYLITYERR